MKHQKIITLLVCICISILLTSCVEEQLIVSPEPNIENMLSVNSVHKFTPLKIYPEDSDVFYEGSKIIVRPRQKITIKEFLESYPYEIRLDSTVKENIEIPILTKTSPNSTSEAAPCHLRCYTYVSRSIYKPYPGKTISNFLGNDPNSLQTSITMRDDYGFSQMHVNYDQVEDFINAGWDSSQIIVNLANKYNEYYLSAPKINHWKNSVRGFYIDEPLEIKFNRCDLDSAVHYVTTMATLANPTPLIVGSYGYGGGNYFYICNGLTIINFSYGYNFILGSSLNVSIMCDEYRESSSALKSRWNEFHNSWGHRNLGNFMHLDHQYSRSYATFSDLFSHARNLGLNVIGLYSDYSPLGQGKPIQKLNSFCSAAFSSYYLRGFAQTVTIHEKCDLPRCVGCEDPDNWYIYQIIYHDNLYEVYP